MNKIHVTAQRDFIESITNASPVSALAELIWNGFDAASDQVQVFLDTNGVGGLDTIRVRDYGDGINHSHLKSLFGDLGNSWKKRINRQNGRALHGKCGKGRFKAFALGDLVEWNTSYKDNTGKIQRYKISGQTSTVDDFIITDPVVAVGGNTGTEVTISNLYTSSNNLINDCTRLEFANKFALYLTEYPNLNLMYDGFKIDPQSAISHRQDYPLGEIDIGSNRNIELEVTVIEWKIKTERLLLLCDEKGIALHTLPIGQQIRAPGFNYTVYIKSNHIRELDKKNLLILEEMHKDIDLILTVAKEKIKAHFRRRLAETKSKIVERWKEEQIYPYVEKEDIGPIELAERQVFDIIASNVETYLPSFENTDIKSRKFTFRLLAQAIKENPDSIQEIITEVLCLKKEDQDDLAELLKKTPLSSIISTAKVVANRLNFLVGLENLLFDKETKKHLLERDQLHKILENEAWLFHEEFALAGSEQRLEEVLQKHLAILGKREDDTTPVKLPDGRTGRVDLMLHKVNEPRAGEYDYLIIELKRPSQKIDADVLTQIEKYAIAVAQDQRFNGIQIKWTFIAISDELDAYAKDKASQKDTPKGRTYISSNSNITVWVKEWAEVINDARTRLHFVNKFLAYEADRDSAKTYLEQKHSKFLPNVEAIIKKEEEKEDKKKIKR